MQANDSAAEKRTAVDYLTFDAKTAKRVAWEAWEFTIEAPYLVRVTNASYGSLKADHSYLVGVEERDGLAVPAECDCPADGHREPDCKHKVALATVGGPTVLDAAVAFENSATGADPRWRRSRRVPGVCCSLRPFLLAVLSGRPAGMGGTNVGDFSPISIHGFGPWVLAL